MTITLHVRPELEETLKSRATAIGMTLDDFIASLVEREAEPAAGSRAEAIQDMNDFMERRKLCPGLGQPITRDLLHEGHGI